MKKLFLLLLALFAIINSKSQVQSDCTVPTELMTYYERDIKQLAVCRMFQIHSADTARVKIPREYIDTIAGGMAGLINLLEEIPQIDSVFNLYCIHNRTACPGEYDGFLVKVDTNYAWTKNWQRLETISGDTLMDTITGRYSLYVQQFYNWSIGCYAKLNTDSTWNQYALCDSLEMVPGVINAYRNGMAGGANFISFNVTDNERYYDFAKQWGDCMAGCIYRYIWKFKVSSDCVVTFLGVVSNNDGEWGDPLPPPSNCNLFTSIDKKIISGTEIKLFPNPADDVIRITADKNVVVQEVIIYTQTGQKVYQGIPADNAIHINRLKAGMYFVDVKTSQGQDRKKLVVK